MLCLSPYFMGKGVPMARLFLVPEMLKNAGLANVSITFDFRVILCRILFVSLHCLSEGART